FDDPEANSGTHISLGGEERLEHFGKVVLPNSGAAVGELDLNAIRVEPSSGVDAENTALRHGVDGIGDDVGEDLHHLASAGKEGGMIVKAAIGGDVRRCKFALIDGEHVLDDILKNNRRWCAVVAIVAERLAGDVRDALQLGLGGAEMRAGFGERSAGASEIDEIENSVERVVDFVGDGCGHAPGGGQLFRVHQLFLDPLAFGDLAGDLRGADDSAFAIDQWRDGYGDIELFAVLSDAQGLVVGDTLAGSNLR